jgi:hypothetical protein
MNENKNGSNGLIRALPNLFVGMVVGALVAGVGFSLSQARTVAQLEVNVAQLTRRADEQDARWQKLLDLLNTIIIQNGRLISALESQRNTGR